MEHERKSMAQFVEIERLIQIGLSDRKIAKALKCRRTYVAEIRSKQVTQDLISRVKQSENKLPPGWALHVDWDSVEKDIRAGFQIKRIWEESAQGLTSHPNFFKYVKTRFAWLLQHTVTLREFRPGEYCEVDYAGDKIEWIDIKTGEIHQAHVFVGILCFSQKIFAIAHENEKKPNWLDAHRRMFEFYGGVSRIVVPDCLKNGVIKAHIYDPDLNPDYVELASHYGAAIVPARARHPRDKALVENAVGILMRYFRFIYRRRTFTSLAEINRALAEAVVKLNSKIHTRFKVSREERFKQLEKATLRPLPLEPYSMSEWKTPTLHPDCTVSVDGNFYSAPHIHRGKELRVKLTANLIEIFLDQDRIALHERVRGKVGERIVKNEHLPENSRAYRETTPQLILSQARFAHVELHRLVDELFQQDTLANLRRAQGLVRKAFALIQQYDRVTASPWIEAAVTQMRRFGRIRVQTFEEMVKAEMKKTTACQEDRTIVRQPGNPMVRGHGTRKTEGLATTVPTPLSLV
jgi:transposase